MSEDAAAYGAPRARLTSQGQITLPKAVRDALGARPGDDIYFEHRDDEIVIRHRRRPSVMDFAGAFGKSAKPPFPDKASLVRLIEDRLRDRHQGLVDLSLSVQGEGTEKG